jgi:hypothetical protein
MTHKRIYGVSYGNGNDGVSQLHPDFYVKTADPWTLARAAMIDQFRTIAGRNYAAKRMDVDGEAEYGIQACIYDPPDSPGWSEHNGAWRLCDVFPVADDDLPNKADPYAKMVYGSIGGAISSATMSRIRRKAKAERARRRTPR